MKRGLTLAGGALALGLAPAALAGVSDGEKLIGTPWEDIVEMARGGEVNWFLWGGSDNINRYVEEYIGSILQERYDITLNRVGLNDTVEAVNIVLGEKQAGNDDNGSVDLIWINGENFRTMKRGELAWCGYVETLPNNDLVNWSNPSIANDFGVPVDGCEVPWSRAQFAFAYDSAFMETPPPDMAALLDWVRDNPGQFTYPAPPDFNGSVFVRHVFYHAAGDMDALLGPFDQETYDRVATDTWALLNDLESALWREGRTYPNSVNALNQLFANRQVAFTFNYEPSQFGLMVQNGTFPETVRSYGLESGTIGNTNYTLIPYNSPNKAAAMVLQNLLLSGEAQLEKAKPDVWGTTPAIDMSRAPEEIRAGYNSIERPPQVVSAAELAENALPELQADWITAIEKGWIENVGR